MRTAQLKNEGMDKPRSPRSFRHWLSAVGAESVVPSRSGSWVNAAIAGAVEWLMLAQAHSVDGGIPAFYDWLRNRWAPSYPETTGYLIPTLLAYATKSDRPDIVQAALTMADYLLTVQSPEGAIPGWGLGSPLFVFDTAQALQGWLTAWRHSAEPDYLTAARRSADWLVAQQTPAGYWTNYQFGGHEKTWDVRVGWPLIQLGLAISSTTYLDAGRRCLDWALTQQQPDGWFEKCVLEPGEPPVLHTIAYAIEGLLEGGQLLSETRHVEAAQCAADALLAHQRMDGSLSGYWSQGWRPVSRSSCLTGNAQMGLCWLRLYQITERSEYRAAAHRILRFVASTQRRSDAWPAVRGAIAGSHPLWGRYLRWRYPNWAAKFFVDALSLELEVAGAFQL